MDGHAGRDARRELDVSALGREAFANLIADRSVLSIRPPGVPHALLTREEPDDADSSRPATRSSPTSSA